MGTGSVCEIMRKEERGTRTLKPQPQLGAVKPPESSQLLAHKASARRMAWVLHAEASMKQFGGNK